MDNTKLVEELKKELIEVTEKNRKLKERNLDLLGKERIFSSMLHCIPGKFLAKELKRMGYEEMEIKNGDVVYIQTLDETIRLQEETYIFFIKK